MVLAFDSQPMPMFSSTKRRFRGDLHRLGLLGISWAMGWGTASGQTLVGSATALAQPGCYQLTPDALNQAGALWMTPLLNVTQPFDFHAQVYLGTSNAGADGMAFLLRNPSSAALGPNSGGAYMGFGGINQSLIVEIDTYTNTGAPANDPGPAGNPNPGDHLAVLRNGSPDHNSANNLAGPVAAILPNGNIEDGQYHDFRVTYQPATQTLQVYFDCVLRLTATVNLQTLLGTANARYGFTASTGGLSNAQRVCDIALSPTATGNLLPPTAVACPGSGAALSLPASALNPTWSPAAGLSSTSGNNVTASPLTTAIYTATWQDACGVTFTETIEVQVPQPPSVSSDITLCPGESTTLTASAPLGTVGWQGGPASGSWTVSTPGIYTAYAQLGTCSLTAMVEVATFPVFAVDLGPDEILCLGETAVLDASDSDWAGGAVDYVWTGWAGSEGASAGPVGPGVYSVEVTTADGCAFSDAITLTASTNTGVNLGPDVQICEGESHVFTSGYAAGQTSWTGPAGLSGSGATWTVSQSGPVEVIVTVGDCVSSDVAGVVMIPAFAPGLPAEASYCAGTGVTLTAAPGADAYLWSNGAETPAVFADAPGWWTVDAQVAGCSHLDEVWVAEIPLPVFDLGPDAVFCEGTSPQLSTSLFGADETLWSGPQGAVTGPVYNAMVTGEYAAVVTDQGCSYSDQVALEFIPLPVFELGPDWSLCPGEVAPLYASGVPAGVPVTWSHGVTGDFAPVSSTGTYVATAVTPQAGCTWTDAVSVEVAAPLGLDLVTPIAFCPGDSVVLDVAQAPNLFPVSYLWSNGEEQPVLLFDRPAVLEVSVFNACQVLTQRVELRYKPCACEMFVPTAFTPDNDGVNDAFSPVFECVLTDYSLKIFNLWGEVVFATQDPQQAWVGEVVPAGEGADGQGYFGANGLYHWSLQWTFEQDGIRSPQTAQGQVLLIR